MKLRDNISDRRKEERRSTFIPSNFYQKRSYDDRRSEISRRRYEREKIQETVTVETKGVSFKIGKYIDISSNGLAFYYIDIGQRPETSFKIDIIDVDNKCLLRNLSFKTITDIPFEPKKEFEYSQIPLRRRGGVFYNLSKTQVSQLEQLIKQHMLE